jgi:hypothetical protein
MFFFDCVLQTPPVACIVPENVFDGFGWCASASLRVRSAQAQLRCGAADIDALTSDNPAGMLFIVHGACPQDLPLESAEGHTSHAALNAAQVLAPWAIDDATDSLFATRTAPHSVLSLWTRDFAGLYWGLHDWSHFHNHGPFEARAWTELQCDFAALCWVHANRTVLDVAEGVGTQLAQRVIALSEARFQAENLQSPRAHLEECMRNAQILNW